MDLDREPTRDEKQRAVAYGLLAAQQGHGWMDCRWRSDSPHLWERVMRSYWTTGWVHGNADKIDYDE